MPIRWIDCIPDFIWDELDDGKKNFLISLNESLGKHYKVYLPSEMMKMYEEYKTRLLNKKPEK